METGTYGRPEPLRDQRGPMTASLEFLTSIQFKLASATGEITGYGSTFGGVDFVGDSVAPGAFAKSLAEHRAAGSMPALLWQHDPGQPIGVWLEAREDQKGLWLRGKLTLEVPRAAEARALAKDGALALSMGFRSRDAIFEKGRRILKDVQLFEVSLVSVPANPEARLTSIKSAIEAGEITPRLVERIL
ncbi:HK97 family phage prohead protease, partial [Hypericibacter sp.]|uniref:HK97 family phage prohead protease n=1 Tax=Hypericibacter sp. TaxID=2705401 RepID=UPI003D6C882B